MEDSADADNSMEVESSGAVDTSATNGDNGENVVPAETVAAPDSGHAITEADSPRSPRQVESGASQNSTKSRVNCPESVRTAKVRAKVVVWAFIERPVIKSMSKAQRKRAQSK